MTYEHGNLSYIAGRKNAYTALLRDCLRALGHDPDDTTLAAQLASERQEAITALRELCGPFGDNDWPDDLHLVDIIEKHLGRYLWAKPLKGVANELG